MNIREYGLLFWTAVGVLALLVASPFLSRVLVYPRITAFIWVLETVWAIVPTIWFRLSLEIKRKRRLQVLDPSKIVLRAVCLRFSIFQFLWLTSRFWSYP